MPATLANLYVRPASAADIAYIADLSARVQAKLTASGSLQQIGPIPIAHIAAQVEAGNAHLLVGDGRPLGSVFVEPLGSEILSSVAHQPLIASDQPLWFLSKLMIEPQMRRRGLGNLLLDAAKQVVAKQGGILLLDCWAGNDKLQTFYTNAGFKLYGVFSVSNFEIVVFTWDADS